MVWKESLMELSGQPTVQEINLILKKETISRQWMNFSWQVERKGCLYNIHILIYNNYARLWLYIIHYFSKDECLNPWENLKNTNY